MSQTLLNTICNVDIMIVNNVREEGLISSLVLFNFGGKTCFGGLYW